MIEHVPVGEAVRVDLDYKPLAWDGPCLEFHADGMRRKRFLIGFVEEDLGDGQVVVSSADLTVTHDDTRSDFFSGKCIHPLKGWYCYSKYGSIDKKQLTSVKGITAYRRTRGRDKLTVPAIACSVLDDAIVATGTMRDFPANVQFKKGTAPRRQMRYVPGLPTLKNEQQQVDKDEQAKARQNQRSEQMGGEYGYECRPAKEDEEPNLITSLAEGYEENDDKSIHFPCLDLDIGAKLVPSQTPGHYHLYLGVPVTWRKYKRLLRILSECGIIESGYADASIRKGFTSLRPPMSHIGALIAQRVKNGESASTKDLQMDLTIVGDDSFAHYVQGDIYGDEEEDGDGEDSRSHNLKVW